MNLPSVYEPDKYESDIYKLWEQSNVFAPKNRGGKGRFSIVLPPPNANGNLHVGHSLMFALQDVVIRYHRMKGKEVLWVPGADHAGFETQVVYEKELAKDGKSRFDYSRDELYEQIWHFVAGNRGNYESQFRRLGASLDWNHFTFTLDDKVINRAYDTFKMMWDDGLIYRGTRLVNFCTFHGTAFADIEVEHKETKGHIWEIAYPLTDGSGHIVVATTRPETMLGDTAVAVHPDDKRYKKFIGKTAKLPLTNREIPIIADEMVDREFGTGAVKITPAHDPNDFEAGERHDLPQISIIAHDGTMTHEAGEEYRGLSVEEARQKVVSDLEDQRLLQSVKDHTHNVGHCYKCGTVIQPLLREQWFVDMKPLTEKALKALKDNKITFYPTQKQDQLITYLENLKDWNISRQIAWGIPIPAFQNVGDDQDWIFDTRVNEELITVDGKTYKRDPDVFDTWFSSASWPYVTLDYPDSEDYEKFYPNSLLETGGEILYPWVSRMIMLGLYVTGKVPFKTVYIHGYVMAEDGSKMSKSVGNVIDPMAVLDKYGSDALRMGLIAGRAPAINRGFDVSKVEGARNFCNKLWNIARFIEGKVGNNYTTEVPKPQTAADHWVLSVLQQSLDRVGALFEDYRFAEAYELVYHTIWNEVADWYIEASKTQKNSDMLAHVLETILKLAHPFAPFVTETIWQTLGWQKDSLLIINAWPTVTKADKTRARQFEEIREVVSEIRQLAKSFKLLRPDVSYAPDSIIATHRELLLQLTGASQLHESTASNGVRLQSAHGWLEVPDKALTEYISNLRIRQSHAENTIKALKKRLANKSYVANAPEHVVQETKDNLAMNEASLELLRQEAKRLES